MAAEGLESRVQELLQLPATRRIPEAAVLGRELKDDNERLIATIAPLVNHAPAIAPELLTDDGLSEVIPPPQRDMSKHFDSHWAALVMAASSRNPQALALLLEELKSPSSMFQNFVARHLMQHGNYSDEFILVLIKELPPRKRRVVLLNCIRARRTSVLDQFANEAKKIGGLDLLTYFVHACSTPVLEKHLASEDVYSCRRLQWKYICRHHSSLIVQFIAKDLEKEDWTGRRKVWDQWNAKLTLWKAVTELLYNGRATSPLLQLWRKYPIYEFVEDTAQPRTQNPAIEDFRRLRRGIEEQQIRTTLARYFVLRLPDLLQTQLHHVVQSCTEEWVNILCETIKVLANGAIGGFADKSSLTALLEARKVRYRAKKRVLDHIFSLSTPFTLYYHKQYASMAAPSWDLIVFSSARTLLDRASPNRRVEMVEYFFDKFAALCAPCTVDDDFPRMFARVAPSVQELHPQLLQGLRDAYSFDTKHVSQSVVYTTRWVAQVDTSSDTSDVGTRLRLKMTEYSSECVSAEDYHRMWRDLVTSVVREWTYLTVGSLHDLQLFQTLHSSLRQLMPSLLYNDSRQIHLRQFEAYCGAYEHAVACLDAVKPDDKYDAGTVALAMLITHLWDPRKLYDSDVVPQLVRQWVDAVRSGRAKQLATLATTNRTVSGQAVLWYGHEMLNSLRNGLSKLHDAIHAADAVALSTVHDYAAHMRAAFIVAAPHHSATKDKLFSPLFLLPYIEDCVKIMHEFVVNRPLPVVPASSASAESAYSFGEYVWSRGDWNPEQAQHARLELERLVGTSDDALLIKPTNRGFCNPLAARLAFPKSVTVVTIVETALTVQVEVNTTQFSSTSSRPQAVLPAAVSKVTLGRFLEKFCTEAEKTVSGAVQHIEAILVNVERMLVNATTELNSGRVVKGSLYANLEHYQKLDIEAVQLYSTAMSALVDCCVALQQYSDSAATTAMVNSVFNRTVSGTMFYEVHRMTNLWNHDAMVRFFDERSKVCSRAIEFLQHTAKGGDAIRALKLDSRIPALMLRLSSHYEKLVTNTSAHIERRWAADVEQLLRLALQHVSVSEAAQSQAIVELETLSRMLAFLQELDLPQLADQEVFRVAPAAAEDKVLFALISAVFNGVQHAKTHDMASTVWVTAWEDLTVRLNSRGGLCPAVRHQLAAMREMLLQHQQASYNHLATSTCSSIAGLTAIVQNSGTEFVRGLPALLLERLAPLWHAATERVLGGPKQCSPNELQVLRALNSLTGAQVASARKLKRPLGFELNQWELFCKQRAPAARLPESESLFQLGDPSLLTDKLVASCWRLFGPRLQALPFFASSDLEAYHRDLFLGIVVHMPSPEFQAAMREYCTNAADRLQNRQTEVIGFLSTMVVHRAHIRGDADLTVREDIAPLISIVLEGTVTADRVPDVTTFIELGNHVDRPGLLRAISYPQLLEHLAKTEPATLGSVFAAALTFDNVRSDIVAAQFDEVREIVSKMLLHVLDESRALIDQTGREILLKYLDISNPSSRKLLTKLSDSNSPSERLVGLELLLRATLAAKPADLPIHMRRTTAYFVTKLKNESVDNRANALAMMLQVAQDRLFAGYASAFAMHWVGTSPLDAAAAVQMFSMQVEPLGDQATGQTTLQNILTMLSDALEVQDLDEAGEGTKEGAEEAMKHPVLRTFWRLSRTALALGALMGNVDPHGNELMSFGFEIQWRVWLFRAGERGAAERFRLDIGDRLGSGKMFTELESHAPHLEQLEDAFVSQILRQHDERITPINPEYMQKDMTAVLSSAYVSLGAHASKNRVLQDYLDTLTAKVQRLDFVAEDTTPVEAVRLEYNLTDVHDRLRAGSGVYQPLLQPDGSVATMGGRTVYCCEQLLFENLEAIDHKNRASVTRYLFYDSVQGMWCVSDMMQSPANMSRVLAFCKSPAQTPLECDDAWSITTRAIHRSHAGSVQALAEMRKKTGSLPAENQPPTWDSAVLQVSRVEVFELDQLFDTELASILAAVATTTGLPSDERVVTCILAVLKAYQYLQRCCVVDQHTFSKTVDVLLAIWGLVLERPQEYAAWKDIRAPAGDKLANLWLEVATAYIEIGTALPLSQPLNRKYRDVFASKIVDAAHNSIPRILLPKDADTPIDVELRYLDPNAELSAGNDEISRKPYFTQRLPLLADLLGASVHHMASYDLSITIHPTTVHMFCPQYAFVMTSLSVFGAFWFREPSLARFAELTIEHTQKYAPRDSQGLIALEEESLPDMTLLRASRFYPVVALFRYTMSAWTPAAAEKGTKEELRPQWDKIDLCNKFVDLMLHSREARVVLLPWLRLHSEHAPSRAERQRNRDKCFGYLLDCTRSAVHLRMLQRHMTRFRPEWLELCDSTEPITGPFFRSRYLGNELVRLGARSKAVASIRTAAARSHRFSNRVAAPIQRKVAPSNPITGYDPIGAPLHGACVEDAEVQTGTDVLARRPLTLWEEEMAMAKFRKSDAAQKRDAEWEPVDETGEMKPSATVLDYIDLSDFRLCYSLHRFSVQQCQALGERYLAQARNKDRAMPERVKSLILWTLLPSTDFTDVIDQVENHSKGMGTNLKEALLKGVMKNDEVLAPMYYLLRPAFLSSQAARIVTFALPVAVPLLGSQKMLQLLQVILTGDRRKALKVTTYKEVIRLLSTDPNPAKIKLIVREWRREQLHRDVRVVILQCMLRFLSTGAGGATVQSAAWDVLVDCATSPLLASQTEVLDVLLSVVPVQHSQVSYDRENVWRITEFFNDPRIVRHLRELPTTDLPPEHQEQFARRVLLPLCRRLYGLPSEMISTAAPTHITRDSAVVISDDIAYAALCRLRDWWDLMPKAELTAHVFPMYEAFLADKRPQALRNQNPTLAVAAHGKFEGTIRLVLAYVVDGLLGQRDVEVQAIAINALKRLCEHYCSLVNQLEVTEELSLERGATLYRICALASAFEDATYDDESQTAALQSLLECARLCESVGMFETGTTIRRRVLNLLNVDEVQECAFKVAELYVLHDNPRQRAQLSREWQSAFDTLSAAARQEVTARCCQSWFKTETETLVGYSGPAADVDRVKGALVCLMIPALVGSVYFIDREPGNFVVLLRAVIRLVTADSHAAPSNEAPQEDSTLSALFSALVSGLRDYHQYDSSRQGGGRSPVVQRILQDISNEVAVFLEANFADPVARTAAGWCLHFVYELEQFAGLWGSNRPELLTAMTPRTLAYIESCLSRMQQPRVTLETVQHVLSKAVNAAHNAVDSRRKRAKQATDHHTEQQAVHALVSYCCTARDDLANELLLRLLADSNEMVVKSMSEDWSRLVEVLLDHATDAVLLEFGRSPDRIRFFLTPFVDESSEVARLASSLVQVFRSARANSDLLSCDAQAKLHIPEPIPARARVARVVAAFFEDAVLAVPVALAASQPSAPSETLDRATAQQLATVYLALAVLRSSIGCGLSNWALGTSELCRVLQTLAPLACAEQCVESFAALYYQVPKSVEHLEPVKESEVLVQCLQALLSIGIVESAEAGADSSALWSIPPAPRLVGLPAELGVVHVAHYRRAILQYCLMEHASSFTDAAPLLTAAFKELQLPLPPSSPAAHFDVVFEQACTDGVATVGLQKQVILQMIEGARAAATRSNIRKAPDNTSKTTISTPLVTQLVLERVQEAFQRGFYAATISVGGTAAQPAWRLGDDGRLGASGSSERCTVSTQFELLVKLLHEETTTIAQILCSDGQQDTVVTLLKLATLLLEPAAVVRVLSRLRVLALNSSTTEATTAASCASVLAAFMQWSYDSAFVQLPHASKMLHCPPGRVLCSLLTSTEGVATLLASSSDSSLLSDSLVRFLVVATSVEDFGLSDALSQLMAGLESLHNAGAAVHWSRSSWQHTQEVPPVGEVTRTAFKTLLYRLLNPFDTELAATTLEVNGVAVHSPRILRSTYTAFVQVIKSLPSLAQDHQDLVHIALVFAHLRASQPFSYVQPPTPLYEAAIQAVTCSPAAAELTAEERNVLATDFASSLFDALSMKIATTDASDLHTQAALAVVVLSMLQHLRVLAVVNEEKEDGEVPMTVEDDETGESKASDEPQAVVKKVWIAPAQRCLGMVKERLQLLAATGGATAIGTLQLLSLLPVDDDALTTWRYALSEISLSHDPEISIVIDTVCASGMVKSW